MRNRLHRQLPGAALTIVATLALAAVPALRAEEMQAEAPGRFTAVVISLGGLHVGGTSAISGTTRVTFDVQRTSTEAERDALLAALKNGGSGELWKALGKMKPVGRVILEGELGYDLRYARVLPGENGQQHIILATDRPIQFAEIRNMTRSRDYDISVVELVVNDKGRGSGTAIPAAQVVYDEGSGDIEVVDLSTSPVQLLDVRKAKK